MEYSDLTVIIPTLNEVRDVPRVISSLQRHYPGCRVIVSDDGSTDGTKAAVLKLGRSNGNVSLCDRTSEPVHGLTASVVDAAMRSHTRYTIVMDGDGQHPIGGVGGLYRELSDGSDISVGVRTAVRDWGLYRRILSKGIIIISKVVFAMRGKRAVSDMMSGFFGIRTELFRRMIRENKKRFVMEGYKVLIDTLKCVDRKTKIVEMPYSTFHKREHGKSKLTSRIMLDVLRSLFS